MTKAEVLLPEPLSLTCRRCGRSGLPQPPPPLPVLLLISNRVTMTRAAGGRERGENLPSSTFLGFFFFKLFSSFIFVFFSRFEVAVTPHVPSPPGHVQHAAPASQPPQGPTPPEAPSRGPFTALLLREEKGAH